MQILHSYFCEIQAISFTDQLWRADWLKKNPACRVIGKAWGVKAYPGECRDIVAFFPTTKEARFYDSLRADELKINKKAYNRSMNARKSFKRADFEKKECEELEKARLKELWRYRRDGPLPAGIEPGTPEADAYTERLREAREVL